MIERRKQRRDRTYLGSRILFNNRCCVVDGVVRNLTGLGARFEMASPVYLSPEFDIIITPHGRSRRARTVWREELVVGVEFVREPKGQIIPFEAARRLTELRSERDALARRVRELSEPS